LIDGTPERIEGLRHPCTLDGAHIKHVADCHCPAQMRQQQLTKLDLALGDDAVPFVPAEAEEREMHWRVHQEKLHDIALCWMPDYYRSHPRVFAQKSQEAARNAWAFLPRLFISRRAAAAVKLPKAAMHAGIARSIISVRQPGQGTVSLG
jgi:hypothetical protein